MGFFKYWNQADKSQAFEQFGFAHLAAMVVIFFAVLFALKKIKKLPPQLAKRIIIIATIALPALELSHTVWLYLCGNTNIIKLLPLHLCTMQSFFIPIAVFKKSIACQEFIYATSVLGGICGIAFPIGVAEMYPFFHYQTLQTLLLHSLLIFIPLALIATKRFTPDIRRFPKVIRTFCMVAIPTAIIDFTFGENYMFLNLPPEGTPLVAVFNATGRVGYLIVLFVLACLVSMVMYIPFMKQKKKEEEQQMAVPSPHHIS